MNTEGRPNILVILTDQQSALAMSCAGNADLRTPAMDRLAAEGLRFERAYCNQPLCGPNRASMFSGQTPLSAGVPKNGLALRPELVERSLGHLISRAGYDCVYGGKWHVPAASMAEGFGFRAIAPFNDHLLTDACVDYLRGPRDTQQPFFMVASYDNPHNICEWARGQNLPWGSIGEPPPVEECPNLPTNFAPPAFEPEIIRVEQQADWQLYPSVNYSPEQWRRYRWAYYRLVEKVDREIGRLLEALDESGAAGDTLVIFSSDHGDGHGAHQWNQKSILYEEIIRVPMIVRWPGRTPAGRIDLEHLVANGIDLLPTLCDIAGADVPGDVHGRSLRPLIEGGQGSQPPWREELVVETVCDRGYNTEGRALLSADGWKYIVYASGQNREQLFDLKADPGEMLDRSVEARCGDILQRHRRRLADYCQATDMRPRRFRVPGE